MPTKLDNLTIPLSPQSIQDLAWGLSLFFSKDEQEQKFGEAVNAKWDNLAERYKDDLKALEYLDNVNAVMSGTIYNLAQLRQQVKDQFEFLDALKERRIKDLDDLANLSKDAESIATRIAGVSIGGASLSFLGLANNVLGEQGLLIFLIGAGIAYFILQLVLRDYRNGKVPEVMKEIQQKKKEFLEREFQESSGDVLAKFLKKVSEIAERIYGTSHRLNPGQITAFSSSSAEVTSKSFLTGGTTPPTYYIVEEYDEEGS